MSEKIEWTIERAEGWPFPRMTEIYKRGERVWLEVTREQRDYALEVLPPVYLPGAFGVGEIAAHDAEGRAVRSTYVSRRGRYFAADLTADAYPEARAGLEAALTAEAVPS